jgi:hypothetical protein
MAILFLKLFGQSVLTDKADKKLHHNGYTAKTAGQEVFPVS